MANFNKVILMGNLTRDPQLSYLPSNTPVSEMGIAVNRRYRRQDGESGEETLFIDCRAYGRQGEILANYVSKGSPLMIEGRLQLSQWQDREGNPRSKHRVIIENFQFMGGGTPSGSSEPPTSTPPSSSPSPPPSSPSAPAASQEEPPGPGEDDDIPF